MSSLRRSVSTAIFISLFLSHTFAFVAGLAARFYYGFMVRGAPPFLLTLLLAFPSPSSADDNVYLQDFAREQKARESSASTFLVGRVPQSERASPELIILQMKDTPSDVYRLYGRIFVPGGVLSEIVKFAREYDRHACVYTSIQQSKTCSGTPDAGITFRYWTKPGRPTVTESIAHHRWIGANRYAISSTMTGTGPPQSDDLCKINLKPHGWVHNLDTFWRYETADGGVYIESEGVAVISTPPVIGYLFIDSSLKDVLRTTFQEALKTIQSRFRRDRG